MTYVDGFVIPIAKKNIAAYRKMATIGKKVWMKHGALDYKECVADDMKSMMGSLAFPKMTKAKPNETIIFSFIVFKSRTHRDQVNKKVMKDPLMNDPKMASMPMPFDMKKMAYGGFKTIVEA
jgi:uncharacterized protein YbaA (DUF1428 family)